VAPGRCSSTDSGFICFASRLLVVVTLVLGLLLILEQYDAFASLTRTFFKYLVVLGIPYRSLHPAVRFPLAVRQRVEHRFHAHLDQLGGRRADGEPSLTRSRGSRLLVEGDPAA